MSHATPARIHVIAVIIATTAALFARAWLHLRLLHAGYEYRYAADISYLVVPPILLVLLLPVILKDKRFLKNRFRREDLTARVVLTAIAIGLLIRVAWRAQIVARIYFDMMPSGSSSDLAGPVIRYSFPSTHIVLLGILVTSFLIPVIEEVSHRGYVQTYFEKRGPVRAIAISTIAFVVFHRISDWGFVALVGSILGVLYWRTNSLWAPVVVHSVVNLLPQLSLRYMDIQWNPAAMHALPLWPQGLVAAVISLLAVAGIIVSLFLMVSHAKTPGHAAPAPANQDLGGNPLDDV